MSSARNRELLGLIPATLLVDRGLRRRVRPGARRPPERVADLRRRLPRALPRRAPRHPRAAPRRGPVPLPDRRGARERRPGDDLPPRRHARARAGAVVRRRARVLRRDDRAAARLPQARALPLPDRRGQPAAAAAAARPRPRRAGQRRLPRRGHRPDRVPAGGVREDRDHHLPGELPARHAAAARPAQGRPADDPAAQAPRAAAARLGPGDGDARLHPRPRLVADVLRRVPRDALRRDEPADLPGGGPRAVRRRRLVLREHGRPRARPRRGVAAPVRPGALRPDRRQLPARAVAVRAGRRRRSGARGSASRS